MDTSTIIAAIDDELEVLNRVRNVLSGHGAVPSAPASQRLPRKRKLSAKARKAISDAQKRRWAKQKRAAKAAARPAKPPPKKAKKKLAAKKEAPKAETPAAS
jgi:hypothetical protein